MLLILGFKRYVDVLGVVTAVCRVCGHPAAQRVEQWASKFTLFFIPLFTTRRRQVAQCAYCGAQYDLSGAEAEQLLAAPSRPAAAG